MKIKENSFIKNVFSMLLANGISFLISSLITFIIPKYLNVENYAYIQLYIFYSSYISYLHWGWVDGIRLRYGGIYYDKIDKPLFKSQILLYSVLQTFISTIVIVFVILSGFSGNRFIALLCVGVCMLIRLPRLMPQYILEMSNRIKECSKITLIEKITYFTIIIILLLSGKHSVLLLLTADLIGQIAAAIYAFACCSDILHSKSEKLSVSIKEAKNNICVGIKLTVANISSLLIIGIVRQFIEKAWDVSTFGKISLTISISNLLMVFIRAVSMVMFPALRRVEEDKLNILYEKIRTALMIPLFGMLLVYYPLYKIVGLWLPQYNDSLIYMALLFPMCVFESKTSMLIETYLKTLRMENILFKINIFTVFLSFIISIFTTFVFHNLTCAVLSIVVLLAFRCILLEKILARKMKINVDKSIIIEIIMVVVFITSSWFIKGIFGAIVYLITYIIYAVSNRRKISKMLQDIKERKRK